MPFLLSLSLVSACSAEQQPHACFVSRAQLSDRQLSWLVSGRFEPSQPQRIILGLRTHFSHLLVIHSTSHHTTSPFFSNHSSNHIDNFRTQIQKSSNAGFRAYLYSTGSQRGNMHQVIGNAKQGDLIYSTGPHRNRCQPQPTQEKLGKDFGGKMQVNGPLLLSERVESYFV